MTDNVGQGLDLAALMMCRDAGVNNIAGNFVITGPEAYRLYSPDTYIPISPDLGNYQRPVQAIAVPTEEDPNNVCYLEWLLPGSASKFSAPQIYGGRSIFQLAVMVRDRTPDLAFNTEVEMPTGWKEPMMLMGRELYVNPDILGLGIPWKDYYIDLNIDSDLESVIKASAGEEAYTNVLNALQTIAGTIDITRFKAILDYFAALNLPQTNQGDLRNFLILVENLGMHTPEYICGHIEVALTLTRLGIPEWLVVGDSNGENMNRVLDMLAAYLPPGVSPPMTQTEFDGMWQKMFENFNVDSTGKLVLPSNWNLQAFLETMFPRMNKRGRKDLHFSRDCNRN